MKPSQNPPSQGPRGKSPAAAIAAGFLTEIVGVYGPAEAMAGDPVNLQVVVKNIGDYAIYTAVTGRYDGVDFSFIPDYAFVDPGASYTFTISFAMPNKDIILEAWSFYWTGWDWHQDDYRAVSISLKKLVPQFRGFGVKEYSKV